MNRGSISAIILHFRPAVWPFVWAHCLTGFVVALGRDVNSLQFAGWLPGLVAGGAWAVFLVGPAAALTSVFGATPRESDDEASSPPTASNPFLDSATPARIPSGTRPSGAAGWIALCLMLIGLVGAPAVAWEYFDAYLIGVVLATLHAAPPIRVGRFRTGSFLAQALGCGAGTFYAGYAAAGGPLRLPHTMVLTMLAFALLFLALRVLMWRASGLAPWLYVVCVGGGFVCFGLAEVAMGGGWIAAALGVPALAAWALLGLARYAAGPPEQRVPRLGAALGAWFVTDVAVALAALIR